MRLQQFDELLSKQMTRKKFLLHLGLFLLAVSGISGFFKNLFDPRMVDKHDNPVSSQLGKKTGFGSGPYGV